MNKIVLIFLFFISTLSHSKSQNQIIISSAISLKEVVDELVIEYKRENPNDNIEFLTNFGASGSLRMQIENGAPVDIVMFADTKNVNKLKEQDIIASDDIIQVIYNSITLIGYKPLNNIGELNGKLIALGQPELVPLGDYSKEYLENVGLFEDIKTNIIFTKDAKAVFNYVEQGEVDYGIIYGNEIKNLKNSKIILELDNDKYTKPKYSFAILKENKNLTNEKFFKFLQSNQAKIIYTKNGFKIL
ncbi:molybdate ABC transporter substrate-binding protein [Cetobacterium sp. 2A]|uniref:molybdate ABC transporter substrate-binding protein n=1 Tax=Cetobacterium sp. 2A TaxID=2754723 RepID=UPI00163C4A05|nr:molybdate ABC transporter substrate-binding protein [Cetobacterium sp. 2A]MBC2857188.1 molybdate ABC transporter substrate-binding protein [Cetobacterium sp. 2A]